MAGNLILCGRVVYLTARPSKTIIGAAHQQITKDWWSARFEYDLFISQVVWRECSAGDPQAAGKRLAILEGLNILAVCRTLFNN